MEAIKTIKEMQQLLSKERLKKSGLWFVEGGHGTGCWNWGVITGVSLRLGLEEIKGNSFQSVKSSIQSLQILLFP